MNILKIKKPIVLVGLMGSGKTTIGYRLASQLEIPFYDTDKEIEKNACCSISDLFYYAGESYFRKVEFDTIDALLEDKSETKIIATGGGSFINPEIRKIIKDKAISVWIQASLEVILERVSRKNHRPLLESGDKKQILQSLISERYPTYQEADITVMSDNKTHNETVKSVVTAIEEYLNVNN